MKLYEIYPLEAPEAVSDTQWASSPEEALERAAAADPACIYDARLLTLVNQLGAHGVRAAGKEARPLF